MDLVGIEPTTSSMPWKRAPKLRHRPTCCGDATFLLSPLARSIRQRGEGLPFPEVGWVVRQAGPDRKGDREVVTRKWAGSRAFSILRPSGTV